MVGREGCKRGPAMCCHGMQGVGWRGGKVGRDEREKCGGGGLDKGMEDRMRIVEMSVSVFRNEENVSFPSSLRSLSTTLTATATAATC